MFYSKILLNKWDFDLKNSDNLQFRSLSLSFNVAAKYDAEHNYRRAQGLSQTGESETCVHWLISQY